MRTQVTRSGKRAENRAAMVLDLPQFSSSSLNGIMAIKETIIVPKRSDEFRREAVHIALTSGLTRKQVASDLGIEFSMLSKWI